MQAAGVGAGLLAGSAWIGLPWSGVEGRPAPRLRRAFAVPDAVATPRLEVTALGVVRVLLDGEDVSPGRLVPGWSDYRHRVRVAVVELGALGAGDHVLGLELAEGWWSGHVGYHRQRARYGSRPWGRARLLDGDAVLAVTDASWRAAFGRVRHADLQDGEHVDLREPGDEWATVGFDDGAWSSVEVGSPDHGRLVEDRGPPIVVAATEPAVAVTRPLPGVQVVDVGRNLAGHVRIRLDGPAGTEVALRHAEALEEDGTLYRANLREARQTDRIVLPGGPTTWEPTFTSHGFRYVEVTGLPVALAPEDVEARVVRSDLRRVGGFACSEPRLERLHQLLTWSIESNSIGLPTDCPQRDERLGWLEDVAALVPTRCFLYDHRDFLARWLDDVRDAQADDGWLPDVAPLADSPSHRLAEGAPGWADAGVQVPWLLWQWYGDASIVHDNLAMAARFVEALAAACPDGRRLQRRGADYGDWLAWLPASKDLVAQAHAVRTADALAGLAAVAGDRAAATLAADLAGRARATAARDFVRPDGDVDNGSASALALALHDGLVPDDRVPAAVGRLVAAVRRHGDNPTTGYLATGPLLDVLTRVGRHDVAWDVVLAEGAPGWMHLVDSGATSLWERWDGWTAETGLHQAWLNSLNHASLGVVGEWLHGTAAGLSADAPGWSRVRLAPRPGGGLDWAEAWHEAPSGPARIRWERNGDRLRVEAEVAVDAVVSWPDGGEQPLAAGTHELVGPAS